MGLDYLMYLASVFYFFGYIPDIYANWVNKNANIYNLPERILFLTGSCFAVSYSVIIHDNILIVSYVPLLAVEIFTLFMRIYYCQLNRNNNKNNNKNKNYSLQNISNHHLDINTDDAIIDL